MCLVQFIAKYLGDRLVSHNCGRPQFLSSRHRSITCQIKPYLKYVCERTASHTLAKVWQRVITMLFGQSWNKHVEVAPTIVGYIIASYNLSFFYLSAPHIYVIMMSWIFFLLYITSWERHTLAKQGDKAARRAVVVGSGRTVRTDERGSKMLTCSTVLPSLSILPVGATTTVLLLPYAGAVRSIHIHDVLWFSQSHPMVLSWVVRL